MPIEIFAGEHSVALLHLAIKERVVCRGTIEFGQLS